MSAMDSIEEGYKKQIATLRDQLAEAKEMNGVLARAGNSVQQEREELRGQLATANAELAKWPRVYWQSSAPKSLSEGYRVASVAGKTSDTEVGDVKDIWLDVYVYVPGEDEPMAAPDDFGIYDTQEAAIRSLAAQPEQAEPIRINCPPICNTCGRLPGQCVCEERGLKQAQPAQEER